MRRRTRTTSESGRIRRLCTDGSNNGIQRGSFDVIRTFICRRDIYWPILSLCHPIRGIKPTVVHVAAILAILVYAPCTPPHPEIGFLLLSAVVVVVVVCCYSSYSRVSLFTCRLEVAQFQC